LSPHQSPIAVAAKRENDRQQIAYGERTGANQAGGEEFHLAIKQRLMLNHQPAERESDGEGGGNQSEARLVIKPGDSTRKQSNRKADPEAQKKIQPKEIGYFRMGELAFLDRGSAEPDIFELLGNYGEGEDHAKQPEIGGDEDSGEHGGGDQTDGEIG